MEIVDGIILSKNEYRDNLIILNLLTPNGFISTIITLNQYNKSSIYNDFSVGKFTIYMGPGPHYKVKEFEPTFMMTRLYIDLMAAFGLDFIKELMDNAKEFLTKKCDKLFDTLKFTLKALNDNLYPIRNVIVAFYFEYLKILGVKPSATPEYLRDDLNTDEDYLSRNLSESDFEHIILVFTEILYKYVGISINSYYNMLALQKMKK